MKKNLYALALAFLGLTASASAQQARQAIGTIRTPGRTCAAMDVLEAQLAALRATVDLPVSVMLDDAAAKAAGFTVRGMDDLEVIEGIGPKIAGLFRAASIATFSELAQTPVTDMQAILDKGGSRFRLAKPDTWAAQAALAARNDWAALRKMHDELPGGTRKKTGVQ